MIAPYDKHAGPPIEGLSIYLIQCVTPNGIISSLTTAHDETEAESQYWALHDRPPKLSPRQFTIVRLSLGHRWMYNITGDRP